MQRSGIFIHAAAAAADKLSICLLLHDHDKDHGFSRRQTFAHNTSETESSFGCGEGGGAPATLTETVCMCVPWLAHVFYLHGKYSAAATSTFRTKLTSWAGQLPPAANVHLGSAAVVVHSWQYLADWLSSFPVCMSVCLCVRMLALAYFKGINHLFKNCCQIWLTSSMTLSP